MIMMRFLIWPRIMLSIFLGLLLYLFLVIDVLLEKRLVELVGPMVVVVGILNQGLVVDSAMLYPPDKR